MVRSHVIKQIVNTRIEVKNARNILIICKIWQKNKFSQENVKHKLAVSALLCQRIYFLLLITRLIYLFYLSEIEELLKINSRFWMFNEFPRNGAHGFTHTALLSSAVLEGAMLIPCSCLTAEKLVVSSSVLV